MKPWTLLVVGALLLVGSGASALGLFASGSGPEGAIAEDSITIQVTDPSVFQILPVTGTQLGMILGIGLVLVAAGWSLLRSRRSKKQKDAFLSFIG